MGNSALRSAVNGSAGAPPRPGCHGRSGFPGPPGGVLGCLCVTTHNGPILENHGTGRSAGSGVRQASIWRKASARPGRKALKWPAPSPCSLRWRCSRRPDGSPSRPGAPRRQGAPAPQRRRSPCVPGQGAMSCLPDLGMDLGWVDDGHKRVVSFMATHRHFRLHSLPRTFAGRSVSSQSGMPSSKNRSRSGYPLRRFTEKGGSMNTYVMGKTCLAGKL